MSGYLEVKYPFKSNLGLNPFKVNLRDVDNQRLHNHVCITEDNIDYFGCLQSWKRQWCILRPSPTSSGGVLAVYCSEAGAAAGAVELPAGCVVRRAKSRSKPYAFAVFGNEDHKPRVLLAASTLHDANSWMDKIRALLYEDKSLGESTLNFVYIFILRKYDLFRYYSERHD